MKNLLILIFIISIFSFSCKKNNVLGVDVVVDEDISDDVTWTKDKVYLVDGNVEVAVDAILTIEAGTTVKFAKDAELDVGSTSYGTLIAKGTATDPIIFTSNIASQTKGDYYGIWLFDGANNCEFEYCTFEYGGGYDNDYGVVNLYSTNASFKNCTFKESGGYGIYISEGGFNAFSSNTFNNNANSPIYIYANYVQTIGTGNVYDIGTTIDVYGGDINASGTVIWRYQGIPFKILGDISIGSTSGTTLNLEPKCILEFSNNVEFSVGGTDIFGAIKAEGTVTDSIFFTSSASSPTNGDWYGIWFYDGTMTGTVFDYCHISYGGGYDYSSGNFNMNNNGSTSVKISNSTISNSAGYGIYVWFNQTAPTVSTVNYYDNNQGNYYAEH